MAEGKGEGALVWGVLLMMAVAGVVALVVVPGPPAGPHDNLAPRPEIAPRDFTANLGDTVSFTAENSSDPDGTIRAFAWSFGDGATASGAIVSHVYEVTGAFAVTLEITDNSGAKNSTSTRIWVNLRQDMLGTATWNKFSPAVPSVVSFPVDLNATRVELSLQINTSAPAGAHALVSVIDPNGAVLGQQDVTVTFGAPSIMPAIVLDAENLTVNGQWQVKVEAAPANAGQISATIGFTGLLRVEYKPA